MTEVVITYFEIIIHKGKYLHGDCVKTENDFVSHVLH